MKNFFQALKKDWKCNLLEYNNISNSINYGYIMINTRNIFSPYRIPILL